MSFEASHEEFLQNHLRLRSGERRGRLQRGHAYAEKLFLQQVWWPLFGTLDYLHPEYEVADWNRKSQFLDFAYLPPYGRFGLEIDSYQSHIKDVDREKFSYSLNRDTFLTAMGWTVLHFSFDDVQQRPELCRMLLQMVFGPYLLRTPKDIQLSPAEKEVLRLAWSLGKPIRTMDVIEGCQVTYRTARKWLQGLTEKGMMRPIARAKYTCCYELVEKDTGMWP
ncbi:hypothetical protein [Gorillibacterium timonense]|uniref:hypothetical protein n=1 Tax=Gorillibacterium timonense TaxID=1689269 RepID=UPI00071C726A|nr:hypothetical protein [Gorillibacterium timonense]